MAFDSSVEHRRRLVDVKLSEGGERGAFMNGVLRVLNPHIDYGTLIGRSAGGMEALCLATAQHQAYKSVSSATLYPDRDHQGFRNTVAKRHETITDNFWWAVCHISSPVRAMEMAHTIAKSCNPCWQPMPLVDRMQQLQAMNIWLAGARAAQNCHDLNPLINIFRNSVGDLDNALGDPRVSRVITDSVDWQTAERHIATSQDEDGIPTGTPWQEYIATACIPLTIPPLYGRLIDGALQAEGDMLAGTPVATSRRPLLHIDLGRPDYKGYGEAFGLNDDLANRAAEADAAPTPILPTDRPTAVICFPDQQERRGVAALPTPARVRELRALGMATATAALPTVLHDLELSPARSTTVSGARIGNASPVFA